MRRRTFLRGGLAWGGVTFLGGARAALARVASQSCDEGPLGELLGLVPLHGDSARATVFGEIVGGPGLDARRFTDLSTLSADRLMTPASEMFLRTAAPPSLASRRAAWPLPLDALERFARPMGAHLIECSGNTDPDNFGLMSVAEWDGVPLADAAGRRPPEADALLVSGMDYDEPSRSSRPGASWILPLEEVRRTGAFLALRMNGAPLPDDHGAPVRLVVPGWYGCCWIKWVDSVRWVTAAEPPTAQMAEFALRTHQRALPARAADYEPPAIDLAAMPIRVEKRRVDRRLEYRIVGILWGGDRPVDRLKIRFRAGEAPVAFTVCPVPRDTRTWSLWTYRWRPTSPGVYSIALTAADASIRTRRLDVSFYVRKVVIDEIGG